MNPRARILVCGVNWLGDACMSMPALQAFRTAHPDVFCAMLVKPSLEALWHLHPAVDDVRILAPGHSGVWRTAAALREGEFDTAYIFPNSWRSALVPFLAGIPSRIGTGNGLRRMLLTHRAERVHGSANAHQQWEYANILGVGSADALPPPALRFPAEANRLPPAPGKATIGLIPGAARGPSKQWPERHVWSAARHIRAVIPDCRFALFGTAAEIPICRRLADALQPDAVMLAGETTLPQLAATLAACDTVICNDSGGMHLAAAVGVPVTAIFGLTDPARTGPLGAGHCCLVAPGGRRDRDIARNDPHAALALSRVEPGTVAQAALDHLARVTKRIRP